MISFQSYRSRLIIGKLLCSSLVLMYGFVPFYLDKSGIYTIIWAYDNLVLSLIFSFVILFIPNYASKFDLIKFEYSGWFSKNKIITIFLFFLVCLFSFSLWPWHEDRVSLGASFSAFCRAVWVINTFCFVRESEFKKNLVLIMTAVLVFVDESRTYFVISFFVLSFSSKYVLTYFSLGMLSLVVVAAVRVGEGISGLDLLTYGLIGEGYNGAKSVGQVFEVSDVSINKFFHLLLTFLQPFYFPIEFLGNKIFDLDLPTQDSFLAGAVQKYLGEKLSPMGGWYILSDFIYYGFAGIPLLFFYTLFMWRFTSVLFDTRVFPFAPFVFFISIKATPYVYVKFVYYIFIVVVFLSFIGVLKKGAIFRIKVR